MKRKNSYEDDQNPTKKARTGNNEELIQDSAASAEEKQLAENGDNIGLDFLELPMEIILAIMHHLNFNPKGEDDYVQLIHNCDMLSQTCKELNVICRDLLEEHLKGVEDLKLMHLSLSRNSIWTRANFAAYNGYFSRLLFARETGSRWDEKTCAMAAMGGQIKILAYLHENGCRWSSDTTARAAMNGHVDCLSYALENGCSLDNVAYSLAAKHGQLTVLQYLHEHGHPWKEDVCFNAVKYGHFSCLKYAHEHGCGWNSVYICREAVLSGRLEVLQYLHEKGTEWHEVVTDLSASLGHFEMLIYAYENGCPFSDNVCTRAAAGNLECLIYVHENGAEWNEETCYAAASYGSLECLKYAHENGAYWDYKACDVATDLCRLDCVEYMHENGIQCRHTAPHLYALGLFEEQ